MQAVVKTLKAAEAACVKVSFHSISFLLTHLVKKTRKNGIEAHDLRDTGAMLYRSLAGSRSSASSIYTRYMKIVRWFAYDISHIYELRITNKSESDLHNCEAT